MRYIVYLVLSVVLAFGADVNKKLFSENNASSEIKRIRTLISAKTAADEEEQNNISIQKLFLNKIELFSSSPTKEVIKPYKRPKTKDLSQKEFLKYFDNVAKNLDQMHRHEKNEEVLHKQMALVKEHLKGFSPDQKDEILQAQLQYAYLKWKEIFNKRKIEQYEIYLKKEKDSFRKSFSDAKIDLKSLEKKTDKQNVILQNLYQKKAYLELRLEKETILVAEKKKIQEDLNSTSLLSSLENEKENWKYNFVLDELKDINQKISKAIKTKNDTLLLRQIKYLQDEKLESYILTRDIMLSLAADLSPKDREIFDLEMKMLEWLKYEHIGDLTAIWYDFGAWADKVYLQTVKIVNAPLFYQNDKAIRLSDFIKMFLTIFIGFLIAIFYQRRVNAVQRRVTFIQKQSFKIIGNIGYYIIVIVTIAISLSNIGLDLSSLSLVAGALSVGIGFGLKEVVGNFVSGIILMAERSVKIGDFVEIDNKISGNVTDIRMRSVTIKTPANLDVVVPNSSLVQESFTNYTLEEPVRRLTVPFTVAYGVSFDKVRDVILEALEQSDITYVRNSTEYETEIYMMGMDERGINCSLFVYVATYGVDARSVFFRLIYKTLADNNIPIPAPRLEVNMSQDEKSMF